MTLSRTVLLLYLLAIIANGFHCSTPTDDSASEEPKVRTKRGIFWDFFQKIVTTKNLVVDQYSDTQNTFNEVFNLLNAGFNDPEPTKPTRPTTTTPKSSIADDDDDDKNEVSTTTEQYSISRFELGQILGRNFRGLQRVTELELKDAFNQSHYNIEEYRREANKQFANSLAVEKKNQLKKKFKG